MIDCEDEERRTRDLSLSLLFGLKEGGELQIGTERNGKESPYS
jgi:hypothetical protein